MEKNVIPNIPKTNKEPEPNIDNKNKKNESDKNFSKNCFREIHRLVLANQNAEGFPPVHVMPLSPKELLNFPVDSKKNSQVVVKRCTNEKMRPKEAKIDKQPRKSENHRQCNNKVKNSQSSNGSNISKHKSSDDDAFVPGSFFGKIPERTISLTRGVSQEIYYGEEEPTKIQYNTDTLFRRAALGLLPEVEDPDADQPMCLSPFKSAREYSFSPDRLRCRNHSGYRMCRATRGFLVNENESSTSKYYWELKYTLDEESSLIPEVCEMKNASEEKDTFCFHNVKPDPVTHKYEEGHVRVGIATVKANLDRPVGGDDSGYSIRDIGGAFHNRIKTDSDPFKPGDLIGLAYVVENGHGELHLWINKDYKGPVFSNINPALRWYPAFSCYKGAAIDVRFEDFEVMPRGFTPAAHVPRNVKPTPITLDRLMDHMEMFVSPDLCPPDIMDAINVALIPYPTLPR